MKHPPLHGVVEHLFCWLPQPCGGAIPLCMVGEFDLPEEIIDRKVTKMKMISPSNREVDVGQTLNEKEYIGMLRREVLDDYLRKRAGENGATIINGLTKTIQIKDDESPITVKYSDFGGASAQVSNCVPQTEVVTAA